MARYHDPERVRATIDAFLSGRPEPTPADLAAEVLGQYGFTADDVREGLAEGSIEVRAFTDDHGPAATSPAAGPEDQS
jgi:hypothetical protein